MVGAALGPLSRRISAAVPNGPPSSKDTVGAAERWAVSAGVFGWLSTEYLTVGMPI